ncbi:MAG TPA: permease, partial [Methylomirabilota bacterium]|nr:permease [Methylomirabilota bacterium]
GLTMALAGALAGIALSLALTGLLRGLLFEVAPRDPVTFAAVPLALLGVAALACLVPARRAARVDPTVVLRQE